jgi:cold shock CspA family protein
MRTNGRTPRGKMLWFNEEKGHGYIETDEGERLYVEGTGFEVAPPEGPVAGLVVEFRVVEGPGGRFAEATKFVEDIAPRRARRRGSR